MPPLELSTHLPTARIPSHSTNSKSMTVMGESRFRCLPYLSLNIALTTNSLRHSDGICCNYGEGNYTVREGGEERIFGGAFVGSESKSFGSCPSSLSLGSSGDSTSSSTVFKVKATSQLYILGFEVHSSQVSDLLVYTASGDHTNDGNLDAFSEVSFSSSSSGSLAHTVTLSAPIELVGNGTEVSFILSTTSGLNVTLGTGSADTVAQSGDGLAVYKGKAYGCIDPSGCPEVLDGAINYALHHDSAHQPTSEPTLMPTFPANIELFEANGTNAHVSSIATNINYAVVGAPYGASGGAVYIYEQVGGAWSKVDEVSDGGESSDQFGYAASISSNDVLVVGAYGTNDYKGAAYVYDKETDGSWALQANLTATDGVAYSYFGKSVAIVEDTIVIGASSSNSKCGAAYVFTRVGSVWTEQTKLEPSNCTDDYYFGSSVDLDKNPLTNEFTIAVGASGSYYNNYAGDAYVYTGSGSSWGLQAGLTSSDTESGVSSVAISGDVFIAGTSRADGGGGTYSGAVYVYSRNGTSWSQQAKITEPNADEYRYFGESTDIKENTIVVGSPSFGDKDEGSVYVFGKTTDNTWPLLQQVNGFVDWGKLGGKVAIGHDGHVMIRGYPSSDKDGYEEGGSEPSPDTLPVYMVDLFVSDDCFYKPQH